MITLDNVDAAGSHAADKRASAFHARGSDAPQTRRANRRSGTSFAFSIKSSGVQGPAVRTTRRDKLFRRTHATNDRAENCGETIHAIDINAPRIGEVRAAGISCGDICLFVALRELS